MAGPWENWNMVKAQPWELDCLVHAGLEAISEYCDIMLPLYVRTVDANVNKYCDYISGELAKALTAASLKHFDWCEVQTGRKASSTRNMPQFSHYAIGISTKVRRSTIAVVWDAVGLAPFGGQHNTRAGAYFRWQPSEWKRVKSLHYGGVANDVVRYPNGLWERGKFTYW